jgi:UMF1 family MFS transporter
MDVAEVIMFGIALNVTAGIGAGLFAWVDDWVGSKITILTSLAGLVVLGTAILIVETKTLFWIFGVALGVFVGPVQAASRSFMARLAPEELRTQMFGLFAFSGKVTGFLGPLLVGVLTVTFQSQRAGMATVVVLILLGGLLILPVKEPERGAALEYVEE